MYIYIDAMHMVPADSEVGKKFIADQKKKKKAAQKKSAVVTSEVEPKADEQKTEK